jgi:hypothetical protein
MKSKGRFYLLLINNPWKFEEGVAPPFPLSALKKFVKRMVLNGLGWNRKSKGFWGEISMDSDHDQVGQHCQTLVLIRSIEGVKSCNLPAVLTFIDFKKPSIVYTVGSCWRFWQLWEPKLTSVKYLMRELKQKSFHRTLRLSCSTD